MDNQSIAAKENESITALADDELLKIAEQAEARIGAVNKIKKIALKVTNEQDWLDQNGKPYLQATGAEKIARLFGISWRVEEPICDPLEGGHFAYTYKGEFCLSGVIIEAIGTRSSKDGFFKKYKDGIALPPSEIDKGTVKKSAFTNLLVNGITRLLGIRNLTWKDIEEYAGINKKQLIGVEYKGKSRKAVHQQIKPSNPNEPATESQLKAINSLMSKMNINEDNRLITAEQQLGLDEYSLNSLEELTKGQASDLISWLQEEQRGSNL